MPEDFWDYFSWGEYVMTGERPLHVEGKDCAGCLPTLFTSGIREHYREEYGLPYSSPTFVVTYLSHTSFPLLKVVPNFPGNVHESVHEPRHKQRLRGNCMNMAEYPTTSFSKKQYLSFVHLLHCLAGDDCNSANCLKDRCRKSFYKEWCRSTTAVM